MSRLRVAIVLCLACVAIGCGAPKGSHVRAPDRDGDGVPDKYDKDPDDGSGSSTTKTPPPPPKTAASIDVKDAAAAAAREDQQIVYSARLTMAVFEVEQSLRAVESLARNMGGYLAQKHDHEITIRIPKIRFEPTLIAIDKVGDVLHRDVEAEDVTDSYVDIEIRIDNARAMQTRLRLLLDKALVKEALDIEKELARVTQELELLEGKMKVLKDRISFSTITVVFEPRVATGVQARTKLPFAWIGELGLPTLLTLEEAK